MATQPESSQITDHTTRAIARSPGFEQGNTQLARLIRALLGGLQNVEDVTFDLITKQAISTGEGTQLDNIGEILQLDRDAGQTDDDYKLALFGRAGEMGGSGTLNQLLEILGLLIIPTGIIHAEEYFPATLILTIEAIDSLTSSQEIAINTVMNKAKAAGVNLILFIGEEELFIWGDVADADGNGDLVDDVDHGWGDVADADGNGDITPGLGQGGNFTRIF